ncbi:AAHS family benzoate transporter-like MFS transporter [Neobacillus niacini]|uniref:MFS transporter n=1 Tax=Neobacillus niacini TaxID=86668 RepID=UPI00285B04F6|nr:aromatic acid/H+ symport family MFS transporter [Neobacillus niacini]MDR7079409.1 AAHS family benzoate transporter-like MFS transporter [Neobacillus niacini]
MRTINVENKINESRFNSLHGMVLFWCAFIIVFDGYDLVVYGSALGAILAEWGITPQEAGSLQSLALFGMMLGALIFGPLADKIGRKKVILFSVALFSVFTAGIAFIHNPTTFGIFRFIAGLGLGGVMPNAVALMTEYSPKKLKSTLVSMMFSGYSVGGVLAAGIGLVIIEPFGWRALFLVGGIPLLALPFMYKTLEESPKFLIAHNKKEELSKIIQKLDPGYKFNNSHTFVMGVKEEEKGAPIINLFRNNRAFSTVVYWIAFFMCLLMIYGLNTWLPQLMKGAGLEVSGLTFLLVLNFGAIFGAIFGGQLADRFGPKVILAIFFLGASVSLTLLGFIDNLLVMYILVAIAGATTIGTQIIMNAYISQYYPVEMRSSGLGWALGVGRLGAIAGPMIGGLLMTISLPFYQNFIVFAVPGVIAFVMVILVQEKYSSTIYQRTLVETQLAVEEQN